MGTRIFCDADSIIYLASSYSINYAVTIKDNLLVTNDEEKAKRAAAKHETKVEEVTFFQPVGHQIQKAKMVIQGIKNKLESNDIVLYLTGDQTNSLRNLIHPSYKSNRVYAKPPSYGKIKKYLMENYTVKECVNIEADDMVVYDAYWHPLQFINFEEEDTAIIATIDKDILRMTPGTHYDYKSKKMITTTGPQAYYNFTQFLLSGDRADNILGLKGFGEPKFNEDGSIVPNTGTKALPFNSTYTLVDYLPLAYKVYTDHLKHLTTLEVQRKFITNLHLLFLPTSGEFNIENELSLQEIFK